MSHTDTPSRRRRSRRWLEFPADWRETTRRKSATITAIVGAPMAPRVPASHRHALALLADCPQEGCTEAVMLAHGFTIAQLVELVHVGLATATPERIRAGRTTMEIATLRITDAGWNALGVAKP
jgi:hypothetical protein